MSDSLKKLLKVVLIVDALAFIAAMLVKRLVPEHGNPASERFRVVAVTDGRRWSSTSEALEVGAIVAVMGGVELDLTDAQLAPEGARLELITIMGGVEVSVPDDWSVSLQGIAVMGGHDAGRRVTGGPELTLHCTTVMGGVQVEQVPRLQ